MLFCKREQQGQGTGDARGTQAETASPVRSGARPLCSRGDSGRMGEAGEHHKIKKFFLTINWRCKEIKYLLKHEF